MRTFADVMDAAEVGSVDYGLLPIESTLMGGVGVPLYLACWLLIPGLSRATIFSHFDRRSSSSSHPGVISGFI